MSAWETPAANSDTASVYRRMGEVFNRRFAPWLGWGVPLITIVLALLPGPAAGRDEGGQA